MPFGGLSIGSIFFLFVLVDSWQVISGGHHSAALSRQRYHPSELPHTSWGEVPTSLHRSLSLSLLPSNLSVFLSLPLYPSLHLSMAFSPLLLLYYRLRAVSQCPAVIFPTADDGAGLPLPTRQERWRVRPAAALRARPVGRPPGRGDGLSLPGIRLWRKAVCRQEDRRERDATAAHAREW